MYYSKTTLGHIPNHTSWSAHFLGGGLPTEQQITAGAPCSSKTLVHNWGPNKEKETFYYLPREWSEIQGLTQVRH